MMSKFKITIDDNDFDVTVNETAHNKAKVEVNGISYDVRYESKNVPTSPLTRKVAGPVAPQVQVICVNSSPSAENIQLSA